MSDDYKAFMAENKDMPKTFTEFLTNGSIDMIINFTQSFIQKHAK